MEHDLSPFVPNALERAVPRYTSYPTAPHFRDGFEPDLYARWLTEIGKDKPLSLYLHIPFCDELCWFCACRTQGTRRYAAVSRYLDALEVEIRLVAATLGGERPISHMHWGGGSPTVMQPDDICRLSALMRKQFPGVASAEFAVEIDPRDMTEERLDALMAAGMTRASIGVQDFDEDVQRAIGRMQGQALTADVMRGLRARGIDSINIDLLYGLPRQTEASLARTIEQVVELAPDRLALFGYAHVPWMAKRQRMIDGADLPGLDARRAQSDLARRLLARAGYHSIGIDHFAKPGDGLAIAATEGRLRRNFQGYTVEDAEILIGLGASAIGSLPQGYVQNEPSTADYQRCVQAGRLPVRRGISLSLDDRMRRDAIEGILCDFALDIEGLESTYGDFSCPAAATAKRLLTSAPDGALEPWKRGFQIAPAWRGYARLIAAEFDVYLSRGQARHSVAL
ncbi:MAG: oxygen-independent coproporphyrinogen III oxidase [Pseudomonadota bacterium]